MRSTVVALVATLAVAPLAPLRAQPPAGQLDGVAMVMQTKWNMTASGGPTMETGYDSYLLFRGGVAIRGIPPGAPSTWDGAALARTYPKWAGRWSESGRELHIVTTAGEEKVFKDWFRMTPGAPDERLDGKWWLAASIVQPSVGDRGTSASAVRQLVLHPDGRFEGALAGGTSSGGIVTATQRASAGQYHIDGYEIEFRYDDGTTQRQLYCYSTAEHGTLVVGSARLIKRK